MAAGLFGKLRARLTKEKSVGESAEIETREYSEQDFLSDLEWTDKTYLLLQLFHIHLALPGYEDRQPFPEMVLTVICHLSSDKIPPS